MFEGLTAFASRHTLTKKGATLYFHYPCFDGIISGVLALDFLVEHERWKVEHVCPINYRERSTWLTTNLPTPSAVVDFLYHPQALFWADHHVTTFMDESGRSDFEHRKGQFRLYYNERAGSCALLLWRNLARLLSDQDRYGEMVEWADKIDSALYSSIEEAIFGDAPALRINFSLMHKGGDDYGKWLVRQLGRKTLTQVAQLPEIVGRYQKVRAMIQSGLDLLEQRIVLLDDEIAAFDVMNTSNVILSRYAPYYFFPNARYSIGILRQGADARITAMRNPWREFESVSLGKIFERYGGGGHQRVASVVLRGAFANSAEDIADKLLRDIRETEFSETQMPMQEGAVA